MNIFVFSSAIMLVFVTFFWKTITIECDFFRYPALHSFLFDELKIATRFSGDGFSGRSEASVANAIHPSLCPILILLSRLKPSLVGTEADDPLDPFLFMPFIRRCATQSNLRVRVLASRALTGLVSNEKLPAVLKGVARCLPSGGGEAARKEAGRRVSGSLGQGEDDEPAAATPVSVSFNSIHGILMQLNSLVDGNCRSLKDDSKRDVILSDLVCDLWRCSWMGSSRSCPCPTLISSFLRVLGHMLDVATVCKSSSALSIRALLLRLSSECLDGEESGGLAFFDPTAVEVRKQAAASFFGCFSAGDPEALEEQLPSPGPALGSDLQGSPLLGLQEKMRLCISDPCCEVRLVTLKSLLKFIRSAGACASLGGAAHGWLRAGLQPTLMELLAMEGSRRCVYYILSNIFSWNLLHFVGSHQPADHGDVMHIGAMGLGSVLAFWERLGSLAASTSSGKARAVLICCMGLCIRRLRLLLTDSDSEGSSPWGRWGSVSGCVDEFLRLVKKHSSPAEPVNLRKAAADGIVASGLLEEAILVGAHMKNGQTPAGEPPIGEIDGESGSLSLLRPSDRLHLYGTRVLEAWFTCIQLLEDEDASLRQKLAADVQGCIGSHLPRQSPLGEAAVPLQVERVIELSFDFLSSIFGNWVLYLDHLLAWVFHSGDQEAARSGDLVRQVFDKEIDNHHEEKLLICQICCSHCEKLLRSPPWAAAAGSEGPLGRELSEFLGSWRSRFLHRLVSFSGEYLEGQRGGGGWVGGVGNHKDAFLRVYGGLLGLYALLQSPMGAGSQLPEIAREDSEKLGEAITPFLTNPLTSRLYALVKASLEGFLGGGGPRVASASSMEDFDPYFLLK